MAPTPAPATAVGQPTGITWDKVFSVLTFPGQAFFTLVPVGKTFNDLEIPIYVISGLTYYMLGKLLFGGRR